MDHPDGTQDLAPQVDSLVRGVCLYWTSSSSPVR